MNSIFPDQTILLFREKDPWRTPNGKWARIYGRYSGANVYESDDNFQDFEERNVIPIELNRQ